MSILDMANLVSELAVEYWGSDNHVSVLIDRSQAVDPKIYAPENKISLSINKISSIGWHPTLGLRDMFSSLINYYSEAYELK